MSQKTLLQITYLGGDLPDKAEQVCMDRTAQYAAENGYRMVEISERPIGTGVWVMYSRYLEDNPALKRLIEKCDFPPEKRAQLTSDLVRFHYAAKADGPVLYVDRDAYPVGKWGKGVHFTEYGTHAIDHCMFHSDEHTFFRRLLADIEAKLEDQKGRLQVYWPTIHALVNELCLGKVEVMNLGEFHHIGRSSKGT